MDQLVSGVNQAAQDVVKAAPPVRLPAPASQGSGGSAGLAPAHAASGKRAKSGTGVQAHAAADNDASGSEANASQTDTQIADDPASATSEASPETLPFTGLQLALVLMAGLAALAAGSVMRRTARP